MLTIERIREAVHTIAPEYPIKRVELFGSYAKGTADENSDVDVLVEFSTSPVSLFYLFGFQESLQDELNIDVDVVKLPLRSTSELQVDRTVPLYAV